MNSGVYVPPHLQATRNGSLTETRYPKDQLLQLFRNQRDNADLSERLEGLYVGGWEPTIPNGVAAAGWGRRDDPSKDPQSGADICWEVDASVEPLGLDDLTEEERQVCSSSSHEAACVLLTPCVRPDLFNLSEFGGKTSKPSCEQGR